MEIWTDIGIGVFATVICIIGVLGSFLPIIPGPPISFGGMWLLQLQNEAPFSTRELIFWFIAVAVITILDYVIPSIGTKKFGGSKYGVWGSTIGIVVGLFIPPFGIILGPAIGAFAGELIYQKKADVAFKAAIGSFLGFLAGTFLKFIVTFTILIIVVWQGFFG